MSGLGQSRRCSPAKAGVQDFVPAWAPAFAGEREGARAA